MAKRKKRSASKKKPANKKKPVTPSNNKSSIINSKCLVWRIFHFKERFELPEDMRACRKSGLQFTRDFVSAAGGDEAVGYLKQFGLLANGDGKELGMLKGLYRELINMAAQQSWAKRGYLIDADDKPLSDAQIGKLLYIKPAEMRKILRKFVSVKLIEKVGMPQFDMTLNDLPPRKRPDDRGDKDGKKPGYRQSAEKSVKKQSPLKKRQNGKREKEKNNVNEQRATNGLTAYEGEEKNNGNSEHQVNAQSGKQAAGQGQSNGQAEKEPPTTPTATPSLPSEPHLSDDLGGSHVIPFTAPQTSLKPASRMQHPAGATVAGGYDRKYDKYDEQFGTKVYIALGYRWEIGSPEARREICSFASKWRECCDKLSGLDLPGIDRLGVRAITEARKIGKRKANRKPAAVWNDLMDNMTDARLREAM